MTKFIIQFNNVIILSKKTILKILQISDSNVLDITVIGISTDSRNIQKDNLFVPLKGDNFDGHKYIISVFEKGASFSLCNKIYFDQNIELETFKDRLIIVEDTKDAYFKIMSYWRNQFPQIKCIGIGGTVGKTTTKEFIRRICEEDGETVYTKENLNTPLGMCIAVSELTTTTKYLVCEMGTDSFGEITQEAEIVKPDIGVCLSVGATHASLLGGSIDGVAKAESELVQYFSKSGTILLNHDDKYVYAMKDLVDQNKGHIITFGKKDTDTYLEDYSMGTQNLSGMNVNINILKNIEVPTYGEGNIYNIMASVTIAKELNITEDKIRSGIKNYIPVKGRLNHFKIRDNITIQDDAYNASPQSMKQSIEVFTKLSQDNFKILVLGDMRELGEEASNAHKELVELIREAKPNILVYVGDFREYIRESLKEDIKEIYTFPNIDTKDAHKIINREEVDKIYYRVKEYFKPNSWVLFKASLGTGVWKLVEKVRENKVLT